MLKKGFYYKILKLGMDPRDTGIMWIIRELRKTGDVITVNNLPDFLDVKAKSFLLKRATNQQSIIEESTLYNISQEIY